MTYYEEVEKRVAKVTEEIMPAWMDHRLAEGRTSINPAASDGQLRQIRADLLAEIVDSINEIEGIDEELKRRADQRAADELALADMQAAINRSIRAMAEMTSTPTHLLTYRPSPRWNGWRTVGYTTVEDFWSSL